jgi:hypothetical protein
MKENDFSKFRLPDDSSGEWIMSVIQSMGLKAYTEYEDKVYKALDGLRVGKYFDINDVKEEDREMFIKISCLYIRQHPNVVFNGTYTRIYKEEKYESGQMDSSRKKVC